MLGGNVPAQCPVQGISIGEQLRPARKPVSSARKNIDAVKLNPGSRRRLSAVPGDAIFANNRCVSSCTRRELFGDRLGLPSSFIVAAKHNMVPATRSFIVGKHRFPLIPTLDKRVTRIYTQLYFSISHRVMQ